MHHLSRRLSLSHLSGTSNLVKGSNLWSLRRRSSAASSAVAASDDQAPKICKKKITRAERKSLLESFVNNYRAMNSGKFPSATVVQKEVGGGYYTVRRAIQVMELETQKPCSRLKSQYLETEVKDDKEDVEKSKALETQLPFGSQEIFGTGLQNEILPNTSDSKHVQDPASCSPMNDEDIKILPRSSDSKDVQYPASSSLMNDGDIMLLPHTSDSKAVQDPFPGSLMNDKDFKILPRILDSKDIQDPFPSSLMNDKDVKILPRTLDSKDDVEDKKILPHILDSKDVQNLVPSSVINDKDIKILSHALDSKDVSSVDVGENPSKCDAVVLDQNGNPGKRVVSSATDSKADVITQRNNVFDEESKHMATKLETSVLEKHETTTGGIDGHQHESSIIDVAARETSREHDDNIEPPKKAFEWNLMSIKDGIVNFWRNL